MHKEGTAFPPGEKRIFLKRNVPYIDTTVLRMWPELPGTDREPGHSSHSGSDGSAQRPASEGYKTDQVCVGNTFSFWSWMASAPQKSCLPALLS